MNLVSSIWHKHWPVIILGLLVFVLYSFNLNNALFWDDEDWILRNPYVHEVSFESTKFLFSHNTLAGVGLTSNYYRPFLFLTFATNYIISGESPYTYHIVNNLLHIGAGFSLYVLILLLFNRRSVALFVAAVFLLHPVQTEAVTYVAGRGDPLHFLLMMLAAILFVKNLESKGKVMSGKILASLVFLGLAILSRETAFVFPLLAFFVVLIFFPAFNLSATLKKAVLYVSPHVALVAVYGLLRLTVLNFDNTLNFFTESNIYADNLHVRLFTFARALLEYVRLIFVPAGLHMEHTIPIYTNLFSWPIWLVTFGVVVGVVWYFRSFMGSFRVSRVDDSRRVIWFGVAWFFIFLLPVSGITPINSVMYEHWLYAPIAGMALIIGWFANLWWHKLKSGSLFKWSMTLVAVFYFLLFGYQTVNRNLVWGDAETLYTDILKYEPNNIRVNNNLGNLYFFEGDLDKAQLYYQIAAASGPFSPEPHFNIAGIKAQQGDVKAAEEEYLKAIELDSRFYYAYQGLIELYFNSGRLEESIPWAQKLLQLRSQDPVVMLNIAKLYILTGRAQDALQVIDQALVYVVDRPEIRDELIRLRDDVILSKS